MSVIIRLQNLPWSANALDIRNFFRGLSIPEGGVHIVGGELGDAFIAFSTDEDARQAMMLDGGKIKEIQVKLLLSSRSEMHKVIEAARQNVPLLTLAAPAPVPTPAVTAPSVSVSIPAPLASQPPPPIQNISPFSTALGNNSLSNLSIPGLGNPQEIPQPAVIEPPPTLFSPSGKDDFEEEKEDEKLERKRSKEKDRRRTRSRSRSRDRERKERKRDRRDRSRSRERRRRDRSRSRDRRERKRDRKERSRSRDRSPSRRSRDRRNERKSPGSSQEKSNDASVDMMPTAPHYNNALNPVQGLMMQANAPNNILNNPIMTNVEPNINRFTDPSMADAYNKLQELGKKRNPNAFQGDQTNGVGRLQTRGGGARGGVSGYRRENRPSRFENIEQQRECCVAIKNAPNHTSYGDVRRFFPFLIDKHGIKMINDNMGRRTGTIYVRFCELRSKQIVLQRTNNELKGAQVVVEPLDDEAYDAAVDSFLPYREENDDEDNLIIADTDDSSRSNCSVLKITDLTNYVKEHDIIKAFSEFSLLSILINDCRTSRTKTAYVQFAKPEDARQALDREEPYIFGRREATLTPISDKEFEVIKKKHNDKIQESSGPNSQVMKPQETAVPRDPRQRRQKFDGPMQSTGAPPIQAQPQGNFFPPPYAPSQTFPPPTFGNSQFGGFPTGGSIGPRAATSTWGSRPPFQNQLEPMTGSITKSHALTTEMEEEPLDCVLMKGLPRDATDRTIVTFLSDTGAVPARIHLMLDSNGLPSGDCFCEFRSIQEARMAGTKHGSNLEGCRISVDMVPRSVVEEALEVPKQSESLLGNAPPPFFEPMRGGFVPRLPFRGRGGFDRGGFDRGGFNRGGFDQGRGGFDQSRGGFRGRGGFDRGRGFDGRGRGRGFIRGRGGFTANKENGREEDHDPALEDFGKPGCVVSMENVPFRASIDEILQFFSEFELTHDDVIRRYNERGQPTGDARVAFRTPFDAQRAVKTRHMDTIHDRRINLTIL